MVTIIVEHPTRILVRETVESDVAEDFLKEVNNARRYPEHPSLGGYYFLYVGATGSVHDIPLLETPGDKIVMIPYDIFREPDVIVTLRGGSEADILKKFAHLRG